ncbi:MAG: MaoC/PaaZ C-terminal domain-containing protein [Pseudomonadota bacterium]
MSSSLSHVPALPAMGVGILLRALFKRPQHPPPDTLPERASSYRLDELPLADIARYRAAFGFEGEHIPLTWWYLLAQRAHLATMLTPAFPFRIVGLVHMDNALRTFQAPAPGEHLLIETALRLLPPSSSSALRCTLETTGSSNGAPVFSCTSTYLIRRGSRSGAKQEESVTTQGTPLTQWSLNSDAGRRYARLSGDWNPIHLTRWSARLMGMRAPIIHGMHTLASACAALERASGRHALAIDCRFRAPVALGSTAALSFDAVSSEFVVAAAGKPAVTGSIALA